MSKIKGSGKWRADPLKRTNTGMSIRGKTISNPVLLTDDDEFPIRTPGASIATPLGTDGPARQAQLRSSANSRPGSQVLSEHLKSTEAGEPSQRERATPSSQPPRTPPSPPRAQPAPSGAHIASNVASEGKAQRKKSSLRSVFGRIFGKKQRNSPSPRIPERSNLRQDQHRSDPTALNRSTKLSPQRSASLPINEYNRALRSHSTVTGDFPLTSVVSDNRNSEQGDGHTRPRRATTPSRLWAPGYVDWTGLSPRPASSHARGSKVISQEEAEPYIGMAVTCHPNRRSRSVGEMREVTQNKLVIRRRSDEIKYWRESYDRYEPGLLSPMSSNNNKAEEADDPIHADDPEVPPEEEQPRDPPQPFNFGPMGELAGMKITQAASLETRVLRLETRLEEIERVVSRLQGSSSTDALMLREPPRRSSLRNRSTSANRPRTEESERSLPPPQRYRGVEQTHSQRESLHGGSQARSSSYSRPSTTSTSHSYQAAFGTISSHFPSPAEEADPISPQQTARPLSTSTTIRGAPSSSPTMSKDSVMTAEHYTALTNMILAEQSARQNLENIVRNLQNQVRKLRTSHHQQQQQQQRPSSTQADTTTASRGDFSSFEQGGSSDDDEGGYEADDFRTPNEKRTQFGDEIFGAGEGEGRGGVDELRDAAPRTMSLSQMTLGRGVQPSLNF